MLEIPVGGLRARHHGVALVDDADYELVSQYRWHIRNSSHHKRGFYAVTNIRRDGGVRTGLTMHRLILPEYLRVDHIDGSGLNNQRSNLRPATNSQNMANRRPNLGTSSPYKGVWWDSKGACWRAEIQAAKVRHHLGIFTFEVDAAHAYDAAAIELFGEYARPNFPEEP
jgi:hypothetical protein